MAVSDWSTTPVSNAAIGDVSIAEGCAPGNLNDAIRSVMAEARAKFDALDAQDQALIDRVFGLAITGLYNLTPTANSVPYFTGSNTASITALSGFVRGLLGAGDSDSLRNGINAIGITSANLSATSGHIALRHNVLPNDFTIRWGSTTIAQKGATTVAYDAAFNSWSVAVISAVSEYPDAGAQDNGPQVRSCGTANFLVWNAGRACTGFWIAVGI